MWELYFLIEDILWLSLINLCLNSSHYSPSTPPVAFPLFLEMAIWSTRQDPLHVLNRAHIFQHASSTHTFISINNQAVIALTFSVVHLLKEQNNKVNRILLYYILCTVFGIENDDEQPQRQLQLLVVNDLRKSLVYWLSSTTKHSKTSPVAVLIIV